MSREVSSRQRALQQNSGSAITQLLQPVTNSRKSDVNHHANNRQLLREFAVKKRLEREEAELKAMEEPFKMNRFKQAQPKIHEKVKEKVAENPHSFVRKGEGKGLVSHLTRVDGELAQRRRTSLRSAGLDIAAHDLSEHQQHDDTWDEYEQNQANWKDQHELQTHYDQQNENYQQGDEHEDESLFNLSHSHSQQHVASTSLSSSSHHLQPSHSQSNISQRSTLTSGLKPPVPRTSMLSSHRSSLSQENKNYVSENAKSVIRQSRERIASRDSSRPEEKENGKKHENFGKVPSYILDRKAKAEEEARKKAEEDAARNNGIPPGMILMPEEERLATLATLQENLRKVQNELGHFPIVVETMSRKRAKAELEAKLKEIEDAISLFSKKRVLIAP